MAQAPTVEQAISFKQPGGVAMSPDGRWVAYTVTAADWEDNEYKTQVWIAESATGRTFQLTRGAKSSSNPRWSPDSKRVAFASGREGKQQLFVIDPAGGEAAALTNEEDGFNAYEWSPDGKRIAFTSTGPESKEMKERKEKYGEFEVVQEDYRHVHLFVVDASGEAGLPPKQRPKAEALTSGTGYSVGGLRWSPDGTKIAFAAGRDPDLSSSDTVDLYVLDVASKDVRKLVNADGPESSPVWSPDGKWIAYSATSGFPFYYYANSPIAVVAASGGASRVVSKDFDEDVSPEEWGPEGIYFGAQQKTASAAFVMDAETGKARRLFEETGLSVQSVSYSRDFKKAAMLAGRANEFAEVYVVEEGKARKLTDFAAQYAPYKLATREVISWKSKDGTVIEGVLIKPADYDASKRYPLLVVIHGGPTGVDTPDRRADRVYPIERFVAKGALVLRPNYRGSAGYGEKFRSLNVRNLGVGDAWDVLSGVDHLVSKGMADPAKLGAMGWSQGGYISAFLTTTSARFKAISVGAGISDWMTYYVNTDIRPFTRQYLKATPWDDPEIYRKTSPISYIKQARTPTLIQHGDGDRRVPLPNAYELYQGLRDQKAPARLVVYKGFGHGINKPKQLRHVMEDNEKWFLKYIWGEE
jgi:dipeptidyl aminopeptidase/acylaminoacyl peptidase